MTWFIALCTSTLLSLIHASVWRCTMFLQFSLGGWGYNSALNRALIGLIHGALVYKQPLHNRQGLIVDCPRRVVASVSVLFLVAGKTKVLGREKGKATSGEL